jgi:hypothetical protein
MDYSAGAIGRSLLLRRWIEHDLAVESVHENHQVWIRLDLRHDGAGRRLVQFPVDDQFAALDLVCGDLQQVCLPLLQTPGAPLPDAEPPRPEQGEGYCPEKEECIDLDRPAAVHIQGEHLT